MNGKQRDVNHGLMKFSHYLCVPLDRPKSAADDVVRILQSSTKKSHFSVDKAKPAGGYAKKTSTLLKLDVDLVLIVNNLENAENFPTAYKQLLQDWMNILIQNTTLKPGDFTSNPLALTFRHQGIDFDLLPAPNFHRSSPKEQAKMALLAMKDNKEPFLYSSSLVEEAVNYVKRQSGDVHCLCRLTKFWQQSVGYYNSFNGRSCLFDCIALYAGQKVESQPHELPSEVIRTNCFLLDALQYFFLLVNRLRHVYISFPAFYQELGVNPTKTWGQWMFRLAQTGIYPPENPNNNLLASANDLFYVTFMKASEKSLKNLKCIIQNPAGQFRLEDIFQTAPNIDRLLGRFNSFHVSRDSRVQIDIAPTVKFRVALDRPQKKAVKQLSKIFGSTVIMAMHEENNPLLELQNKIERSTGVKPSVEDFHVSSDIYMRLPMKNSEWVIVMAFNVMPTLAASCVMA